jgi:tetratricopeptide (TPR) repeat protein
MKMIMLSAGLSLLLIGSGAAANTTLTYNLPYTGRCYEAAAVRDTSENAIAQCTAALLREATTAGQIRLATLINRGTMLLAANQQGAALRDFDEALSIDPTEPEALLGKAIAVWNAGDSGAATMFATQALQYGPERPAVAYLIRGLANEQQGQLRAAYSDLQTARSLDPAWSEPARELSRYRIIQR